MINLKGKIGELIKEAEKAGLPEDDAFNAAEYLQYNENGLALDTMVTQLYENDVVISESFYQQVELIGKELKISPNEYTYIKELIK